MEYSALIQREVLPGVSVSAGWYRRNWYNLEKQMNQLVSPSDYSSFQVPNPLPGATDMITVFNLNKIKQGQIDILDTTSTNDTRRYDGIELNSNARLPNGATIFGGWSTERQVDNICDGTSATTGPGSLPGTNPNHFRFCDQTGKLYQEFGAAAKQPFRWDAKVSGSYPLPLLVRVSASFQSVSGAQDNVTWVVPAALFPGGAAGRTESVTVRLTQPGTRFLDRRNQLDLGIRRPFKFGRLQTTAGFDIFNSLNSRAVLSDITAFGTTLGKVQTTLLGRMFRVSANLKW